jgi:hypothetical protein
MDNIYSLNANRIKAVHDLKISFGDELPLVVFDKPAINEYELHSKLFNLYIAIESFIKKGEFAVTTNGDLVGLVSRK